MNQSGPIDKNGAMYDTYIIGTYFIIIKWAFVIKSQWN